MSLLKSFFFILAFGFSLAQAKQFLHPFTSDGCSMFPDGNWVQCCEAHDKKYWMGGTAEERVQADQDLKTCVAGKADSTTLGFVMYEGVRMGGRPMYSTRWRWGYGWNEKRDYKPLTNEERAQVEKYIGTTRLPIFVENGNLTTHQCLAYKVRNKALAAFVKKTKIQISDFLSIDSDTTLRLQVFSEQCREGYFVIDYDANDSCQLDQTKFTIFSFGNCNKLITP